MGADAQSKKKKAMKMRAMMMMAAIPLMTGCTDESVVQDNLQLRRDLGRAEEQTAKALDEKSELKTDLAETEERRKLATERADELEDELEALQQRMDLLRDELEKQAQRQSERGEARKRALGMVFEDMILPDGKTYSDAEIVRFDPERVHIRHSAGSRGIKYEDLPADLQGRWEFPDDVRAEFVRLSREQRASYAERVDAALETRPQRVAQPAPTREAAGRGHTISLKVVAAGTQVSSTRRRKKIQIIAGPYSLPMDVSRIGTVPAGERVERVVEVESNYQITATAGGKVLKTIRWNRKEGLGGNNYSLR